ncbi:putative serine esterase-domain-containing protein [Apodospora peruviana]|uniref:Serine esterase-domain-containing protein n=1 Tax=Apodospora peruviana TaxID=516989 RepID=A0AAE0I4W8_9PEZI|nr:putative serine esterase-domain-containing protein [Apodospora peruviana]
MLLLHQAGSVKIGEVVRYTVTYTPSADRILPSPEFLFLRIKNTSAIALRAAFVHGPYTLSVAAYPSHFNPNEKFENPRRYGVPEFEPMLKAGATWNCHLVVPDNIRQSAGEGSSRHGQFGNGPAHDGESVSWVIEVTSQVIFSTSAAVHYEVLLARDEKSLNLGSVVPVIGGQTQVPQPGRVSDFQQSVGAKDDHPAQPRGVFSRAIRLKVEDTAALWNKPELPGWEEGGRQRLKNDGDHNADAAVEPVMRIRQPEESSIERKQKMVHLVVLTHGLHSNLGADMLFLKESIDAGVKQAKIDARARRAQERANNARSADSGEKTNVEDEDEDDEEDEEVIVRGFSGNATKTEKGIKYLGKRLARFILTMTHPDQPHLPTTAKAASEAIAQSLRASSRKKSKNVEDEAPALKDHPGQTNSSVEGKRGYTITKISFIAHSLGGLVQTYAIAYIQKHSPHFFDLIQPINFITLASPLLGLNHENPLYVKFALDFGLVGRTGQDLGLTWRAPTIARSGWGALVGNLGENAHRRVYGEPQPESKPLLRILPTGPAHTALKKFRNRTVYSNVVNDGIVPLRTSCLLFLDWQGLGRVEKARREAGLVETVVGFGWAELTGTNVTSPRLTPWTPVESQGKETPGDTGTSTPVGSNDIHKVPQPPTNVMLEDDRQSLRSVTSPFREPASPDLQGLKQSSTTNNANPFTGLMNFFRNNEQPKMPPPPSPKQNRIYQRSQTLKFDDPSTSNSAASSISKVTSGHELSDGFDGLSAPPKTTFFEAAGDLLNPKLPPVEYLIDPSKRPRTIFHDRIYHPSDIPPPPLKKRSTGLSNNLTLRRRSKTQTFASVSTQATSNTDDSSPISSPALRSEDSTLSQQDYDDTPSDLDPSQMIDSSQMKVEEKIARAYHRGLSWRKVLVKLEPDAHNNVIVRRMFANAFGWPVVHHLVDAHFSDSAEARTRDEDAANMERTKGASEPPDETGTETKTGARGKGAAGASSSTTVGGGAGDGSENEARDLISDLPSSPKPSSESHHNALGVITPSSGSPSARPRLDRLDSVTWSDRDWLESGEESDEDMPAGSVRRHSQENKKSDEGGPSAAAADHGEKRSSSPSTWNWTEKIVGKGALHRRSGSPKSSLIAGLGSVAAVADSRSPPASPVVSYSGGPGGTNSGDGDDSPAGPEIHVRTPSA